jgi:hypothetical protein
MVNRMIDYEAQLNATRARHPWRTACHITIDAADLDGTWELPSLAESDCAGELELIRYTICPSAMAFENSAAAAIEILGTLFISRQSSGPCSLCLLTGVSEGLLGK